MAQTVTRPAGVAGSFTYTTSTPPASAPTMTIYSDVGRTVVAAASAPTVLLSGTSYTCAYPASLASGTYYLRFSVQYPGGGAAQTDDTATLLLVPEVGVVS